MKTHYQTLPPFAWTGSDYKLFEQRLQARLREEKMRAIKKGMKRK